MTGCSTAREQLGAYALGGLSGAERDAVDRHVYDCPGCAAELSELEDAAALLARVTPADLTEPLAGPAADELGRRRRLPRWQVAAAAAVVVLAAGIGVGVTRGGRHMPTFAATSAGVTMSAQVRDQPGGSAVSLVVDGLPYAEHCTLVAVSRTGARETAGTWTATYDRATRVVETSSFGAAQLAGLELEGTDGHTLVTVPIR